MVKVYTRTGDDGTTHCFKSGRIAKNDIQFEAIGTVDELNSHIGLLIAQLKDERTGENEQAILDYQELTQLQSIQNRLFDVGGALATFSAEKQFAELIGRIDESPLEKWIDKMDESLSVIKQFILPGGSVIASQAHICRSVCRRAERCLVGMTSSIAEEPEHVKSGFALLLRYLNRLSDFLFVLARYLNKKTAHEEVFWTNDDCAE